MRTNQRTDLALHVLSDRADGALPPVLAQLMDDMSCHTGLSPRLRAEICVFINEVRGSSQADLLAYYDSLPRRSREAALCLLQAAGAVPSTLPSSNEGGLAALAWPAESEFRLAQGRAVVLDFGATQPGEVTSVFVDELPAIQGVVSDTARQHGLGRAMLLAAIIELASVEKFHWDTFINSDPAL